jgi:hypothetical protein
MVTHTSYITKIMAPPSENMLRGLEAAETLYCRVLSLRLYDLNGNSKILYCRLIKLKEQKEKFPPEAPSLPWLCTGSLHF